MSATHTHSAPAATPVFQSDADPEYQKFLARRIADAVLCAANNLAPAKIGWGSAQVPDQVFNRRWFMKPGAVLRDPFDRTDDHVKMNPPVGSADLIEPAGLTDPEVVFISIQHTNGKPLALLANYSLHYCGGVGQGVISADYFGMFADHIQELLGADRQDPPFVGSMANGTSGNINNVDFRGGQAKQPPFGANATGRASRGGSRSWGARQDQAQRLGPVESCADGNATWCAQATAPRFGTRRVPTVQHFQLGGYETWRARSSYLETNAAPKIYDAVLGLLKNLE